MKKKQSNTLDKFMVTSLDIKNSKKKQVKLPTGETVDIPRLAYKHYMKVKPLKDPEQILSSIIDDIKPRELTRAETEFLMIHIYYHNNKKDKAILDEIGINLDEMTITETQYDFTFDNIRLVFDKATMRNADIILLIKQAFEDGKEITLDDSKRVDLINSLYRYEIDAVERGVLQEVFVIHEGDTIKGFNIIGE